MAFCEVFKGKMKEKTIKSNVVYDGKILRLNNDDIECDNGVRATREIVHHNGGVCILAFKDNKVVMVKQYRYAFQEELLELPAGKLEKGEDPYHAGIRELEEEVGLKAESLASLGCIYPSCGYTNEIIYLYKANNVVEVKRHLDIDENIDIYYFTLDEVLEKIKSGEIKDAKTIGLILKYKQFNK